MGTSSSGSGPGDKILLLPSWALPDGDGDDVTNGYMPLDKGPAGATQVSPSANGDGGVADIANDVDISLVAP
jgi:hypothetical protein